MNNTSVPRIFLCLTPYHVMLSHLVLEYLNHLEGSPPAFLVLTGSATSDSARNLVKTDLWTDVATCKLSERRIEMFGSVSSVDELMKRLFETSGIQFPDEVAIFAANDTDWRHQVLISAFPKFSIALFEDGMGSYLPGALISNSYTRKFVRHLLFKPILRHRYINTNGLGGLAGDQYYALQSSAFKGRDIENSLTVLSFDGSAYAKWIKDIFTPKMSCLSGGPHTLLISEPLSLDGVLSVDEESKHLTELAKRSLNRDGDIWIKGHPRESRDILERKKEIISSALDGRPVHETPDNLPSIEAMLLAGFPFDVAVGTISTSLITISMLCPDVRTISGIKLLNKNLHASQERYIGVLSEMKVEFL